MTSSHFDVVVIGGGPAGYVGAIRAAQLGMKTACVERDELGGVCLNWGCIPTKTLLAGAEFYDKLKHQAPGWGIEVDNIRHDWQRLIERSRGLTENLSRGIVALFKKNKVTHISGHVQIRRPGHLEVLDDAGGLTDTIAAAHLIIATGAQPRGLPGVAFDGEKIITHKDAMALPQQPKKLVILGAGAIGMEFAYFYNAFGTEVVIVEIMSHLLPNEDVDVSQAIERAWRKLKIKTYLETKVQAVVTTEAGVELTVAPVDNDANTEVVVGDKLLIATGVTGRYDGLLAESSGIEVAGGFIEVDRATYQTSQPGIYAVGDVIGPPCLAHVASKEAVICVERIGGHNPTPIDYGAIPTCTYCHPQVASFGLSEQVCADMQLAYKVGKFPFRASGKAQAIGFPEGFVKILADAHSGEILGVHMIGESVTELLAEMGLAKRLKATADDVIATMHAHPTLSEAVHEASLGVDGRMIHF